MTRTRSILVAGVGNLLMTDDGLGCHLAAALKRDAPPGVKVVDIGTSVIHLLGDLEKADAVLFLDAFFGGGIPGSMYLLDARELLVPRTHASLHDVGIAEALRELAPTHLNKPLILFGVEPAILDYGMELSRTLTQVFPTIVETALGVLRRMCQGDAITAAGPEALPDSTFQATTLEHSP